MRWYPNINDCQMYAEDPETDFPTVGIKHRSDSSKNYPKYLYSWRSGPNFKKWTDWNDGPYLPGTRLKKINLPVAGQMPRYLINKMKPAGFGVLKPIKFDLKEFLVWWRGENTAKKSESKDNTSKNKNKDKKKSSKKKGKKK